MRRLTLRMGTMIGDDKLGPRERQRRGGDEVIDGDFSVLFNDRAW